MNEVNWPVALVFALFLLVLVLANFKKRKPQQWYTRGDMECWEKEAKERGDIT